MRRSYITFVIAFVFSFLCFESEGQEKTIKGYVTTFDSIPLISAKIVVSSSKLIVLTDSIGRFELNYLSKDKLKISANGFSSQKVKIEEENEILHVNLKLKSGSKNHEIAVGYGHVKDEKNLYSIINLNSDDDVNFSQYTDIYVLIERSLVGVQVVNKEIIVRGLSSINGSSAALIIVDGVPVVGIALEMLKPFNVKSINLLKGSSATVYGSRGANGVVLIEMKKGGK